MWVPFASAIVMGIIAMISYWGVDTLCSKWMGEYASNAIAVLVAIMLAVITYFISMIKIGGYTKEMLMAFPKGAMIARLAEKLHLI